MEHGPNSCSGVSEISDLGSISKLLGSRKRIRLSAGCKRLPVWMHRRVGLSA